MYHLHFLLVRTKPSFLFVSKNVFETKFGEVLNYNEVYLKSDRGTQLVNPAALHPCRFAPGSPVTAPRAGLDTSSEQSHFPYCISKSGHPTHIIVTILNDFKPSN
jgi:hypothetical protein